MSAALTTSAAECDSPSIRASTRRSLWKRAERLDGGDRRRGIAGAHERPEDRQRPGIARFAERKQRVRHELGLDGSLDESDEVRDAERRAVYAAHATERANGREPHLGLFVRHGERDRLDGELAAHLGERLERRASHVRPRARKRRRQEFDVGLRGCHAPGRRRRARRPRRRAPPRRRLAQPARAPAPESARPAPRASSRQRAGAVPEPSRKQAGRDVGERARRPRRSPPRRAPRARPRAPGPKARRGSLRGRAARSRRRPGARRFPDTWPASCSRPFASAR